MSDNAEDRMKMLSLNRTEMFFPYDEGQDGGDVYLTLTPSEDRTGLFDDMELFDIDREEGEGLAASDKYGGIFDEEIEDAYDEELTNPIKHYIKEMGGVGLLTREGEKEIAIRIEEAKGDMRQIILSFPVTVKELLDAYAGLKTSKLTLRDITSEADDEDETDTEVEIQKQRTFELLEKLKRAHNRSIKSARAEERDLHRAQIRQIISEINLGRRIVDNIICRMKRYVERVERLEAEIASVAKKGVTNGGQGTWAFSGRR